MLIQFGHSNTAKLDQVGQADTIQHSTMLIQVGPACVYTYISIFLGAS